MHEYIIKIYLLKIRKLASCSTALYGPTVLYGPPVVDAVLHAYDNIIDIEDILQGQESELRTPEVRRCRNGLVHY